MCPDGKDHTNTQMKGLEKSVVPEFKLLFVGDFPLLFYPEGPDPLGKRVEILLASW